MKILYNMIDFMRNLSPIPRDWLAASPNLDTLSDAVPFNSEFDELTINRTALNALPFVIRKAWTASYQAVSYRDFLVGSAAVTWEPTERRLDFVTGYNIRPIENGDINVHAEQMVLEKVRYLKKGRIAALAVWGEPQADEQSGLLTPTLHPCGLCRELLSEAPEISPNTPILSANQDLTVAELYGLGELLKFHGLDNDRDLCGVDPQYAQGTCRVDQSGDVLWGSVPQPFSITYDALGNASYSNALGRLFTLKWYELNPQAPWAASMLQWYREGQPILS